MGIWWRCFGLVPGIGRGTAEWRGGALVGQTCVSFKVAGVPPKST